MADAGRARWEPVPYLSGTGRRLSGERQGQRLPAERRFNFLTVEGVALATAADSLAAVKKLVLRRPAALRWGSLLAALQANFEGHESLRQTLLNKAPKYGNDDP